MPTTSKSIIERVNDGSIDIYHEDFAALIKEIQSATPSMDSAFTAEDYAAEYNQLSEVFQILRHINLAHTNVSQLFTLLLKSINHNVVFVDLVKLLNVTLNNISNTSNKTSFVAFVNFVTTSPDYHNFLLNYNKALDDSSNPLPPINFSALYLTSACHNLGIYNYAPTLSLVQTIYPHDKLLSWFFEHLPNLLEDNCNAANSTSGALAFISAITPILKDRYKTQYLERFSLQKVLTPIVDVEELSLSRRFTKAMDLKSPSRTSVMLFWHCAFADNEEKIYAINNAFRSKYSHELVRFLLKTMSLNPVTALQTESFKGSGKKTLMKLLTQQN